MSNKLQITLSNKNNPNNIKLSSSVNEYLYFQNYVETMRTAQHAKLRAVSKYVDNILNIEVFEHNCIILIHLFTHKYIKQDMVTIVV